MTTLDDRLIPKVYELVEKYGQNATFTVDELKQENYEPETGHVTPDTPVNNVRKVTPPEEYSVYYVLKHQDTTIQGDMKTYLPAKDLPFDVKKCTEVNIEGELFNIVSIEDHYVGEQIALYELHLRQ